MYEISKWKEYQHYGDGKQVPWVKLHFRTLTSQTWMMLDDSHRVLLVTCMLHASENKGEVVGSIEYLKKLGNINGEVSFKPLLDIGFLSIKTSLDNSIKNQNKSPESLSYSLSDSRKGGLGEKRKTYPDEFEEFWKLYPPSNSSKAETFKSFTKATKEADHETIIRSVTSYSKFIVRTGTYVAHATTWLNQKRWEVDYDSQIVSQGKPSFNRKSNFDDAMGVIAGLANNETGT